MIIQAWDKSRNLYCVIDLDYSRTMFIGTFDECKQFQIYYNNNNKQESNYGIN